MGNTRVHGASPGVYSLQLKAYHSVKTCEYHVSASCSGRAAMVCSEGALLPIWNRFYLTRRDYIEVRTKKEIYRYDKYQESPSYTKSTFK